MERRVIDVEGIVQGVGFRPYVHELATRMRLGGFVQNQVGSVRIEVEGEPEQLDRFLTDLPLKIPTLARILHLTWTHDSIVGERKFTIRPSAAEATGPVFVSPDVAPCAECLVELLDPTDRRYRYPFLNCTNCGPRLTILTGAPYDRAQTTLARFPLCATCQAEYEDSRNRRFHAQPTCCPACGPQLRLLDAQGRSLPGDPLLRFAEALGSGQIGALKGLGGYHLVCDARSQDVVASLRRRKNRDEKPLAIMVTNISAAEALCEVKPAERAMLASWRRPIVLLRKRPGIPIAEAVSPGNPFLGVLLPYTPLHHLLLQEMHGIPLVVTSGNRSDEPIAWDDAEALNRLVGVADLFLIHNRPISVRCEDSVTRIVDGSELLVRRSRGYSPEPIALPFSCSQPILAVGGQLKATFALGRDRYAFLSHHLGDLDHYDAYAAFIKDIQLYQSLFDIEPAIIAHDLHPDYASTGYARGRGESARGVPIRVLAVQHHHAHLASCMAENGLLEPVLGVILDGSGYGDDGTIWGGEFLMGDYHGYRRMAHLRPVGLPGGEAAIREPWRMTLAHLRDAGCFCPAWSERISPVALRTANRLLDQDFQCPRTSSVGRLFDAVASLLGLRDRVSYEGQAAGQLEWLATGIEGEGAYSFDLSESVPLQIDPRPMIREVVQDVSRGIAPERIARRFHSTLVEMIAQVCERLRQTTGLDAVVLSGGVFQNALLSSETDSRLNREGLRVYRHRLVPPGDGGLSLGQLAIAARSAVALDPEQGVGHVPRRSW